MPATDLTPIPAKNLDRWTHVEVSADAGTPNWTLSGGSIHQTVEVGKASKTPKGALYLYEDAPDLDSGEVSLSCTLGSEYQTGLVFNYKDATNYGLLWVNRFSETNAAYEYGVVDVRNGNSVVLCTERYFDTPPDPVQLRIRIEPPNLRFLSGDHTLYLWPYHTLETGSKIGLYSQHNRNAQFHSLHATSTLSDRVEVTPPHPQQPGQPQPVPPMGPVPPAGSDSPLVAPAPAPAPPTANAALNPFLALQEPQSKTLIDFSEVFRVPLDSFYTQLYSNPYFDVERGAAARESKSIVLDFRPNRWYRDYQELLTELRIAETDKKSLVQLLAYLEQERGTYLAEKLETQSSLPDLDADKLADLGTKLAAAREKLAAVLVSEEGTPFRAKDLAFAQKTVDYYEASIAQMLEDAGTPQISGDFDLSAHTKREDRLEEVRREFSLASEHLHALRERQARMLREIRTAGYGLSSLGTPPVISDLGYDFHLTGKASVEADYAAYEVDPSHTPGTLNDDGTWQGLLTDFTGHLEKSGVLQAGTELSSSFDKEAAELRTLTENPTVVQTLRELEAARDAENAEYAVKLATLEADSAAWARDRDQFLGQAGGLEGGDYPAVPDNHFGPITPPGYPMPLVDRQREIRDFLSGFSGERIRYSLSHSSQPFTTTLNGDIVSNDVGYFGYSLHVDQLGHQAYFSFDAVWFDKMWFEWHRPIARYWEYNWKLNGNHLDSGSVYAMDPGQRGKRLGEIFRLLASICQAHADKLETSDRQTLLSDHNGKLTGIAFTIENVLTSGLGSERSGFIARWNSPDRFGAVTYRDNTVLPDQDPLARMIEELQQGVAESVETHFFDFRSDGFYTDRGLSIREFLDRERTRLDGKTAVAILPTQDESGRITDDRITAVVNPRRQEWSAVERPLSPTIKFVETYQMEVTWKGYGLGELSHSVNLFPGETKELVVEKKTKLNRQRSESRTAEEERTAKTSESFEDNLENSFSDQQKASASTKAKTSKKTEDRRVDEAKDSREEEEHEKYQLKVGGGLSGVTGSGSAEQEKSTKANWSENRKNTFVNSFSVDNEKATNQSRDILKKNVHKVVRKVASETSNRNKLQVTSSATETFETETGEKEVIRLENPNLGRTINYNFFQVQNLYEITTTLVDVKVVVDPGYEAIEGGRLGDIRVIELEEFGKLYPNLDLSEPRSALLAAFVSRQVLKKYTRFLEGLESESAAIRFTDRVLDDQLKQVFQGVALGLEEAATADNVLQVIAESFEKLKGALKILQGVSFAFQPVTLTDTETMAVNSAAYYLESEVGVKPSTEAYLEQRRDVETKRQQALLEQLRAQTAKGVFFPELPDSVTHLNLANGHDQDGS